MIEVDNSVELDKSQEDYERINAEIIDPRNVTALKTLNGGDNIMLFQRKKDFINLTKVLIKNAYPLNFNEIFDIWMFYEHNHPCYKISN